MQAKIYNAPEEIPKHVDSPSVFLSGSVAIPIEWRAVIIRQLGNLPVTIFNPLRKDWDSTWTPRKTDGRFREQVKWELDALKRADIVVVYLHPASPSLNSLLEMGLSISNREPKDKVVVVCCPEDSRLRGNVEMICDEYNIPLVEDFEKQLVPLVIEKIRTWHNPRPRSCCDLLYYVVMGLCVLLSAFLLYFCFLSKP